MESIGFLNSLLLLGSALVIAGIFSSLIASRFGAPLLFVFLVIGMLAGEDGPGGLAFNDYQLTYLVGSLALAVIIFDGGLRTRLSAFRGTLLPSVLLSTLGVVVTAALTGAFASYVLETSLIEGLLIGAVVASTDAAAVFFMLRAGGLELRRRVHALLEIESGTNDPAAVLLTIVLVEIVLAGVDTLSMSVAVDLVAQVTIGTCIGLLGGLAIAWVINKVDLPAGLHPLLVVASAVLIFAFASELGGSGFVAVYLGGLVLGNRPIRAFASISSFHDTTTWLCQIMMFIILGLLVTPSNLIHHLVPALLIAVWLIVVGRPVAVWLCLAPFKFSVRETAFVAWVGLRGAVSIFLAAIPTLSDVPNASVYFNVAFVVVMVSLILQGWTINPAARRLGLALPRTSGVVHRVELDLPGQLELEMVGYPIRPESPVLTHRTVPRWARPVMVIRDNAVLGPAEAKELRAGDYAYYLTPPGRVLHLDHVFAQSEGESVEHSDVVEFSFNGDVALAQLATLYGLEVPAEHAQKTIAELFADRFDETPELGDRLPIGAAALVVREMDGDRVTKAGLQFAEMTPRLVAAALLRRRIVSRLWGAAARLSRQAMGLLSKRRAATDHHDSNNER